jgi:hypothetical protein
VGYKELTGKSADLIEVLNLDEKGMTTREPVDDPLLTAVGHKIRDAGEACGRTSFRAFRRGTTRRAASAISSRYAESGRLTSSVNAFLASQRSGREIDSVFPESAHVTT